MIRLFISQPMAGKTDDEILAVRGRAIESAKRNLGEEVEVIDSFIRGCKGTGSPLGLLAKALEQMATADAVYFAPGWDNARGCRIEHACAMEYGLDVIEDYR